MTVFNIHKAKTSLSKLVALAEAGEEIVIARHNIPIVKIVPVKAVIGKGESMRTAVTGFDEEAQLGLTDAENIASKAGAASGVCGFGLLAHLPPVPDSMFFEPLSDNELDAWEGKYSTPFEHGPS
jgi:antitoxin (DNA-binding transcriptional repressor) of toxin-antitoxin stability system